MVKYDEGYVEGLLALAKRRELTPRERRALANALNALRHEREHRREVAQRRIEKRRRNGR
jgi:hypothetical protein